MSELYKQILQTPDSFRKLQNSPVPPPVKTQTPMISDELISEIPESETSNYEVSDSELLYSEAVAPNIGRISIPGQDAFIAPASFRPEVDFRSTRFWVGSSGSETIAPRGGVRSGSTTVAEPGMGSLTVTGPTGELVGARSANRLVRTVSGKLRPLSSGVWQEVQRGIREEVLAPELLSQISSGKRRLHGDAINVK